MQEKKTTRVPYLITIILWELYTVITLLIPPNLEAMARYHITPESLHFIQLSIIIPTLFMWLILTYAVTKLYQYTKHLKGSAEERGYTLIGFGLQTFFVQAIVGAFVSLAFQYADQAGILESLGGKQITTIVQNYMNVLFSIVAYTFFFYGSRKLLAILPAINITQGKKRMMSVLLSLGVIAFSVAYMVLVFSNPYRNTSPSKDIISPYSLPDSLILFSIVIPYLIAWSFGVFSMKNILLFRTYVAGIVYRQALRNFVLGISLIIALTLVLQLIIQFTTFWSAATLNAILVFIYVIYFVVLVGYLLVASGAKSLSKMEEI